CQMRPRLRPLTPLEVAIGRADHPQVRETIAALACAHRATGLMPLEARVAKDLVETFRFRGALDGRGAGNANRLDARGDVAASQRGGGRAQVRYARIGAGADVCGVDLDSLQPLARPQPNVVEGALQHRPQARIGRLAGIGNAAADGGDVLRT